MVLKKKDFIEIEFTGRVKEGDVFDSNIKADLEKINPESTSNPQAQAKPFIFSLGEGMFLKGVEDFLEGKEVGKYKIELSPEKAFGNRESKLIRLIPSSAFRKENISPMKGMMFNFDGQIGKVISVSGGRITIDFNNPIAGKTVVYDVNILRKVEDLNEKSKALVNFLFRRDLNFEIKGKKIHIEIEEKFKQFSKLFEDKFKEILDLDLVVEKKEEKGEEERVEEGKNAVGIDIDKVDNDKINEDKSSTPTEENSEISTGDSKLSVKENSEPNGEGNGEKKEGKNTVEEKKENTEEESQ